MKCQTDTSWNGLKRFNWVSKQKVQLKYKPFLSHASIAFVSWLKSDANTSKKKGLKVCFQAIVSPYKFQINFWRHLLPHIDRSDLIPSLIFDTRLVSQDINSFNWCTTKAVQYSCHFDISETIMNQSTFQPHRFK